MAYAGSFHRIVMIGNLYTDVFNVTLAMVPVGGASLPAVSDTLRDSVGTAIAGWWDNPLAVSPGNGLTINAQCALTSVKVNRINAAGLYQDPGTQEWVAPAPVPGGGGTVGAPQLTLVATLRGINERALAGRGRMYWPTSKAATDPLDSTGRVSIVNASQHAMGTRNLLGILNDIYLTAGIDAVAGIASRTGAGAFQGVSKVSVGRVVDTMRSRRNKLAEAPEEVTM